MYLSNTTARTPCSPQATNIGGGSIAAFAMIRAMKVYVVALNDVFDTGLATVLDAFGTANELAEMSGMTSLRFDVTWSAPLPAAPTVRSDVKGMPARVHRTGAVASRRGASP
jgi:hypothetical protein